jgi:hypothetical protein
LPSHGEIDRVLKYLKNNKMGGADSIVAELLAWTSDTLPESWIKGVADAVVQHYQAGFQSGKSTTDQLFARRQILEKGTTRVQHPNSPSLHRLQGSIRHHNTK